MLINITAASQLGIHEVNEACTLIREATENSDVQISFGVVLNETMSDSVKITVIATGFQRDNLPEIERRPTSDFIQNGSPFELQETTMIEETPIIEPEPEIIPQVSMEPAIEEPLVEEPMDDEDIEVPAFARRDRGFLNFVKRSDDR